MAITNKFTLEKMKKKNKSLLELTKKLVKSLKVVKPIKTKKILKKEKRKNLLIYLKED